MASTRSGTVKAATEKTMRMRTETTSTGAPRCHPRIGAAGRSDILSRKKEHAEGRPFKDGNQASITNSEAPIKTFDGRDTIQWLLYRYETPIKENEREELCH